MRVGVGEGFGCFGFLGRFLVFKRGRFRVDKKGVVCGVVRNCGGGN